MKKNIYRCQRRPLDQPRLQVAGKQKSPQTKNPEDRVPVVPPGETLKGEISGNYIWGNSSRVPEKFEFLMRSPILPITTPLAYLRGICHFF